MNNDNAVNPFQAIAEGIIMHERQEKSRLIIKAIFDSTRSSIFFVGPDFKIIFLNKKARDGCKIIYGNDVEIGDCILNCRTENDEASSHLFKESFAEALGGNTVAYEQKLTFPNNNAWVRMEYDPVYDEGKIMGVVIRCANINERKQYELQIDRQRERLEQIAWMQSHETRQPVATILGLINIMDRKSLTKDNSEIITMLEKTVEKLDRVIRHTVVHANSLDGIYD